ncbi:MFS transporter [Pseudomonas sp. TTU2014-080ASC]|uniref:MFS transporter n=1 Tax=Pseudomonas sp. TTU2014-080ASC TaxID=1729724 RepID=UPI000718A28F|nr:MFS transporter [Pseudomonas sp. TTU2014-080ASC]KRW62124.1 MFS transporter [Pseudomonas sp. TTU2014-080ASC]
MSGQSGARRHAAPAGFILLALMLLGLNLRPILASVGPVLDDIQIATGITSSQAGLLTTLPVLAMGICALAGNVLQRLFGQYGGILLGITVIAVACAARWLWHDSSGLIITAALGGLGIALVQALLPAFIKTQFAARVGLVMGLYTTGIMAGAAIAAASVAPLATVISWHGGLAFWAVPALLAALLWLVLGTAASDKGAGGSLRLPLNEPRAWLLMTFFGIATGAYTLVLAWLPPFYTQLGWTSTESGLLLGLVTVAEVVAGLLVSTLVGYFPNRRVLVWGTLVVQVFGLLCLIFSPADLAITAAILLGLGIGAIFPLSLIITMDHAETPAQAGALMSMVQGGGYIIASVVPILAGLIRQRFADLTLAWVCMGVGALVLMIIAARFAPGKKLHF